MPLSRRKFIHSASTVSAVTLMGKSNPARALQIASKKGSSTVKLLRIGVLTCHPGYHHMPNIWGPLINCKPMGGGFIPTRMTGMVLTHIWDNDPERVETFCEHFDTEPVEHYNDMVDKVDGIIISDVRNSDYFPELSEPYFKAGIPVLFNRPFTSSMGRVKKIIEASKKHGTPFMTASGWEFCKEVYTMQRKIEEWGPGIRGVTAYNSSFEITHDVHGVWIILAIIGTGIESVSVSRGVKSIYDRGSDTWTIKFKARSDNPPFYATLHNSSDHDSNAWVKVILEKGTFEQSLWYLGGGAELRYQYYFLPPLLEFQRMIERGTMPQSHNHILEKSAVFLAGFKSHLERNGGTVNLSELEDDFRVPSDRDFLTYPDSFFG